MSCQLLTPSTSTEKVRCGAVRCQRIGTCSLMVLIPSGPSRDTACFTRSVRPQLSIRKPKSCLNLASMATASSLREAQKQSSALREGEMVTWVLSAFFFFFSFPGSGTREQTSPSKLHQVPRLLFLQIACSRLRVNNCLLVAINPLSLLWLGLVPYLCARSILS